MDPKGNHKIFSLGETGFEEMALEIFQKQAREVSVYSQYLEALGIDPPAIRSLEEIPFLPIRFFKTHEVCAGQFEPLAIFESSGTSGMTASRHVIKDLSLYEDSFTRCFERFYGPVKDWCIIGLLPSYLERQNSSLVYMTNKLIELSGHPYSGFYLHEHEKLAGVLEELERKKQKTWLIGVSFALLDFVETCRLPLHHTVIVETGGMKGRRVEMVRPALHSILKNAFGLGAIHSEYGMTELLSQAYSSGEGIFHCPPWMKVFVRDEDDPFFVKRKGSGSINVIDLANVHSCSFIGTEDAGKLNEDGSFEVLGRIDGSDLRGCSLLVAAEQD